MARKFLTPIDLNKLELQNVRIQNLGSDPESPVAGQIYYNTGDNQLKYYNGGASAWQIIGQSIEQLEDAVADLLTAGNGVLVEYDDNAGLITISNTGVTSVTGTDSEVTVSASAGDVTIGLPDNVDIASSLRVNPGAAGEPSSFEVYTNSVTSNVATTLSNTLDVWGTATFGIGTSTNATISSSSATFEVPLDVNSNADISGTLAVGGSAQFGSDVEIDGNLVIDGNLTVSGSTTYVNTETITINDNIVLFNADQTGTPIVDAGIEIERGDLANSSLFWDESEEEWAVSNGSATYAISLEGHTHVSSDITDFSTGVFSSLGNILVDSSTIDFSTDPTVNSVSADVILSGPASASYLNTVNGLEVDKTALEAALVSDSFTRKHAEIIGDGVNNVFDVTHNFSTRDVTVQVYDTATYDTVEVDVVRSTESKVTITFAVAPATGSYKVVIVG